MTFNHDHVFINDQQGFDNDQLFINSEQGLNHDHVFINDEQLLIDIDENENSQDINTTNSENELAIACDAINLIGLIKHNTTDLKHVLCYDW